MCNWTLCWQTSSSVTPLSALFLGWYTSDSRFSGPLTPSVTDLFTLRDYPLTRFVTGFSGCSTPRDIFGSPCDNHTSDWVQNSSKGAKFIHTCISGHLVFMIFCSKKFSPEFFSFIRIFNTCIFRPSCLHFFFVQKKFHLNFLSFIRIFFHVSFTFSLFSLSEFTHNNF